MAATMAAENSTCFFMVYCLGACLVRGWFDPRDEDQCGCGCKVMNFSAVYAQWFVDPRIRRAVLANYRAVSHFRGANMRDPRKKTHSDLIL